MCPPTPWHVADYKLASLRLPPSPVSSRAAVQLRTLFI